MIFAYARTTTDDYDMSRQLDSLNEHGFDKLIQDTGEGEDLDRDGIRDLLSLAAKGDLVIVDTADTISNRIKDIQKLTGELENRGANLKILNGDPDQIIE